MRFANPIFFALLPLVFIAGYFLFYAEHKLYSSLKFPNLKHIKSLRPGWWHRLRVVLKIMRLLALLLLIIAMARPQLGWKETEVFATGIDIMLVLDVSYSMKAMDFKPDRLTAAKKVIEEFIPGRKGDRLGVFVFATTSFLLCPLTLDYTVVQEFVESVEFDIVDGNSTAIGMALAHAIKKLKDSQAKSKIIILLTDGENNAGKIDPLTAAEMAAALNIKVYTIGVGSEGMALVPVQTAFGLKYMPQPVHIDEETLQKIANLTGGKYFRATDAKRLEDIYHEIDKLEKSKIEYKEHRYYEEKMHYFVGAALILILLELLLSSTRLIRIP